MPKKIVMHSSEATDLSTDEARATADALEPKVKHLLGELFTVTQGPSEGSNVLLSAFMTFHAHFVSEEGDRQMAKSLRAMADAIEGKQNGDLQVIQTDNSNLH